MSKLRGVFFQIFEAFSEYFSFKPPEKNFWDLNLLKNSAIQKNMWCHPSHFFCYTVSRCSLMQRRCGHNCNIKRKRKAKGGEA